MVLRGRGSAPDAPGREGVGDAGHTGCFPQGEDPRAAWGPVSLGPPGKNIALFRQDLSVLVSRNVPKGGPGSVLIPSLLS
jgi:hypothetical protein